MKTLVSEEQIQQRVRELAAEITAFYEGKPLTVVILMNGGLLFGADLVRAVRLPLRWVALHCSSYISNCSSGKLQIHSDTKPPVAGRHLLVVDDILDTGFTLKNIMAYFQEDGALSVRSCVLLNKNITGKYYQTPDWVGFDIPDEYVVGYGMDYNEEFRNLPYIAAKDKE